MIFTPSRAAELRSVERQQLQVVEHLAYHSIRVVPGLTRVTTPVTLCCAMLCYVEHLPPRHERLHLARRLQRHLQGGTATRGRLRRRLPGSERRCAHSRGRALPPAAAPPAPPRRRCPSRPCRRRRTCNDMRPTMDARHGSGEGSIASAYSSAVRAPTGVSEHPFRGHGAGRCGCACAGGP